MSGVNNIKVPVIILPILRWQIPNVWFHKRSILFLIHGINVQWLKREENKQEYLLMMYVKRGDKEVACLVYMVAKSKIVLCT